jgi:hypothetical protein
VIINRSIVDPTPEGPRFAGIYRQTRIDGDTIEQIYYAEDADGKFGALVTRRVITRGGVTTEEIFDPPLAEHGITCAASHARCQGGDSGAGAGVVARLIQTRTDDD